uniref:Uncharacterized protein n=1 Tax=viral metagenome TaxID=1070528 RepID=A0A6M3JBW9_9ZZZZ
MARIRREWQLWGYATGDNTGHLYHRQSAAEVATPLWTGGASATAPDTCVNWKREQCGEVFVWEAGDREGAAG